MIADIDQSCPNCVYKRPYERTGPWCCPTCGLIHALRCEPEPTNDPTPFDIALCNQVEYIENARIKSDLPQWLADVMLDEVLGFWLCEVSR